MIATRPHPMAKRRRVEPEPTQRKSERFELRLEPDLMERVDAQAKRLHVPVPPQRRRNVRRDRGIA